MEISTYWLILPCKPGTILHAPMLPVFIYCPNPSSSRNIGKPLVTRHIAYGMRNAPG